jgi:hypothetical protein
MLHAAKTNARQQSKSLCARCAHSGATHFRAPWRTGGEADRRRGDTTQDFVEARCSRSAAIHRGAADRAPVWMSSSSPKVSATKPAVTTTSSPPPNAALAIGDHCAPARQSKAHSVAARAARTQFRCGFGLTEGEEARDSIRTCRERNRSGVARVWSGRADRKRKIVEQSHCAKLVVLAFSAATLGACSDYRDTERLGGSNKASSELALSRAPDPSRGQASATMPAALRQTMITTTQQNAPASYDFAGADDSRDSLHARNDAQGLRTSVTAEGLRVEPETASGNASRWWTGLRLARVGRGTELTKIEPVRVPIATNNRASFEHAGGIEEWYVNGPLGVEQGFVLDGPPASGGTQAGELVVEIELVGELEPAMQADGKSVALRTTDGALVAQYSDLYAQDADGLALTTWISVDRATIALHIEDARARYPVEVDPLVWVELVPLVPEESSDGDRFGYSVAIGDVAAVVGAYGASVAGAFSGAAYVFMRDFPSANAWGQKKRLTGDDSQSSDSFGSSAAVDGDSIVVGAESQHSVGVSNGAAYVFDRDLGGADAWGQRAQLMALDAAAGDDLGAAIAISGDTVLVGAPGKNGAGSSRGAAYLFERNVGGVNQWDQRKKLTASDAQDWDEFGHAVALEGDTAVVGAHLEDGVSGAQRGAVYVFGRNQNGTDQWGEQKKVVPSDPQNNDYFGTAVAISGDLLVVGTSAMPGTAYLFERNYPTAEAWGQRAKLSASDQASGNSFGTTVAAVGDTVMVGAPGASGGGATYVFERNSPSAEAWGEVAKLVASDPEGQAQFGRSLGLSSAGAIIGAPFFNGVSGTSRGKAYLWGLRLSTGSVCSNSGECASGFCVDGVCCDTECVGGPDDCQTCSAAEGGPADGTCGTRVDGSVCSDGIYCNGPETCTTGVCAGLTADPCPGPHENDNCADSCDEATDSCTAIDPDGTGCANDTRTCRAGNCIGGPGTECTEGTQCDSTFCVDDVCCVESECTPYRCGPAGACGVTCIMNLDCASGYSCNVDKQCAPQAPAGSTEDQNGCSCRIGSRRPRANATVLVLLPLLLCLRRKPRRNRRIAA